MSRIRPLEGREVPLVARPFLALLRRMFGKELTPYRVQARRPGILWFGGLLTNAIEKSGLVNQRVSSLVQLRAGQMVGCPF